MLLTLTQHLLLLVIFVAGRLPFQDLSVCDRNPCQNGGVCIDLTTSSGIKKFECACKEGYRGLTCQKRVDPCMAEPCLNGGKCVPRRGDNFHCVCPQGFQGKTCHMTKASDLCNPDPCLPNGMCDKELTQKKERVICSCKTGYLGTRCKQVITTVHTPTTPAAATVSDSSLKTVIIALLVIVLVTLLILLCVGIHCARVYTRRSDKLAAQERRRVAGEDPGEVPGCLSMSNSMCADFFCCRDNKEEETMVKGVILPVEQYESIVQDSMNDGLDKNNDDRDDRDAPQMVTEYQPIVMSTKNPNKSYITYFPVSKRTMFESKQSKPFKNQSEIPVYDLSSSKPDEPFEGFMTENEKRDSLTDFEAKPVSRQNTVRFGQSRKNIGTSVSRAGNFSTLMGLVPSMANPSRYQQRSRNPPLHTRSRNPTVQTRFHNPSQFPGISERRLPYALDNPRDSLTEQESIFSNTRSVSLPPAQRPSNRSLTEQRGESVDSRPRESIRVANDNKSIAAQMSLARSSINEPRRSLELVPSQTNFTENSSKSRRQRPSVEQSYALRNKALNCSSRDSRRMSTEPYYSLSDEEKSKQEKYYTRVEYSKKLPIRNESQRPLRRKFSRPDGKAPLYYTALKPKKTKQKIQRKHESKIRSTKDHGKTYFLVGEEDTDNDHCSSPDIHGERDQESEGFEEGKSSDDDANHNKAVFDNLISSRTKSNSYTRQRESIEKGLETERPEAVVSPVSEKPPNKVRCKLNKRQQRSQSENPDYDRRLYKESRSSRARRPSMEEEEKSLGNDSTSNDDLFSSNQYQKHSDRKMTRGDISAASGVNVFMPFAAPDQVQHSLTDHPPRGILKKRPDRNSNTKGE